MIDFISIILNKYFLSGVGFAGLWLIYSAKINSVKKQTKNEILDTIKVQSLESIKKDYEEKNEIDKEMQKTVNNFVDACVEWVDINRLRSQGKRNLREITDATLRKNTRKSKK